MELLTIVKVAKHFKVSRNTVYNWIASGLPSFQVSGSRPLFDVDTVQDWIKRNERPIESRSLPRKASRMPPDRVSSLPEGADRSKGVYLPSKSSTIYWIAYQVPSVNGKARRVRESSQLCDPKEAAAIRRDRIKAAWKDAPHSTMRSRYLHEAEE